MVLRHGGLLEENKLRLYTAEHAVSVLGKPLRTNCGFLSGYLAGEDWCHGCLLEQSKL
jgi:hypothetical protein